MTIRVSWGNILSLMVIPLVLGMAPLASWADDSDDDSRDTEIPFAVASVFFELNDTDGDLGIHALIDGEPWEQVNIEDPRGRDMLDITLRGRLRKQGLTELFFESAEPTFDELAPDDFFRRFPEGEYEISGETLDGEPQESTAWLSHVIPAAPGNVRVSGVPAPEDCDEGPIPAVLPPVLLTWDPVTMSHPALGRFSDQIEIVRYEVVVERLGPVPLVLSLTLPPNATSFAVPPDLIALDTGEGFKFEILAREASGNQTALESCFEVE
jgi:hypothetical protein